MSDPQQIDVLLAEHLFGWERRVSDGEGWFLVPPGHKAMGWSEPAPGDAPPHPLGVLDGDDPQWSTTGEGMLAVLDAVEHRGFGWRLSGGGDQPCECVVYQPFGERWSAEHAHRPLSVALAALRVLGVEVPRLFGDAA